MSDGQSTGHAGLQIIDTEPGGGAGIYKVEDDPVVSEARRLPLGDGEIHGSPLESGVDGRGLGVETCHQGHRRANGSVLCLFSVVPVVRAAVSTTKSGRDRAWGSVIQKPATLFLADRSRGGLRAPFLPLCDTHQRGALTAASCSLKSFPVTTREYT